MKQSFRVIVHFLFEKWIMKCGHLFLSYNFENVTRHTSNQCSALHPILCSVINILPQIIVNFQIYMVSLLQSPVCYQAHEGSFVHIVAEQYQ